MDLILRGLNPAQKAAVTSTASVLQVLAPPGSGKTKTLTSRVAYLLADQKYAPWNVICCTFTIKASREMRERLRAMVGDDLESKLILGTFHSVCRRYLVRYGYLISLPKNFGIADSDDSSNLVKRIVKRLELGIDPKSARSKISRCKTRFEQPSDLKKPTKNVEAQEFATVFQEYEDALNASNLLDYDDLLLRCVDLLRQYPHCVSNVEALLIDEFQDTNIVQFELMKLLACAKNRVTIVGDPDQSIYGFRSAEIENLQRMKVYYPETSIINLEENYRSCTSILRLAQEVIEQDTTRPEKKLKSTHKYGTLPVLRRLLNPFEEAQWIATEIKRISATTGNMLQRSDFAILLRSAYLSLHIEKALASAGIPYRMVGGKRFFDRVEVRMILEYLKTIQHPDNNSALLSIINTPKRKVGDAALKELTRVAVETNRSLWAIVQEVTAGKAKLGKALSKPAEQGLCHLVSLINEARRKLDQHDPSQTPSKMIEHVVKSLNFREFLKREYQENHEERWENVKELMNQAENAALHFSANEESLPELQGITQHQTTGPSEVLAQFLANVALSTEVEREGGEEMLRVTISTIHAAKGLEWPVVFVPAVYEGSIPHSRAEDVDEERRLLYVAMTRAKALLYLTFPIMQQRDERESVMSQFLPPGVMPFMSCLGPVFRHDLVAEIASITGKHMPSQEDFIHAMQKLKDNESAEDDLWPVDGSHGRHYVNPESAYLGTTLKPGQILASVFIPKGQQKSYSGYTTATSYSTTINEVNPSTDGGVRGFTRASVHVQQNPQLLVHNDARTILTRSESDPTANMVKKSRISTVSSGVGNLRDFFAGKSSLIGKENMPSTLATRQQLDRVQSLPETVLSYHSSRQISNIAIPIELSTHRFSNTIRVMNNPIHALNYGANVGTSAKAKRNHYAAFSSSPTHEQDGCRASLQRKQVQGDNDSDAAQKSLDTMNSSKLPSKSDSLHQAEDLDRDSLPANINKLSEDQKIRPSTTMMTMTTNTTSTKTPLMTTMQKLQAKSNGETRKKTLGIRRSMVGWADRKHK